MIDAVEITVEILEAGVVPKILRPHLTKTVRGLLERTSQAVKSNAASG